VQRTKEVRGSAGQRERENDGDPIPLRGNMHELDAEEIQFWGDRQRVTKKFFYYGKTWPGDIFSKITFDGSDWDQVAPAKMFGFTRKHIEVILRER
jgi:hypothetical protein